jgi:hypothetical protein
MNIRLRSAQSRREALRTGLIGYLGANIERNATVPTAEHLPAIGEVTQSTTLPDLQNPRATDSAV